MLLKARLSPFLLGLQRPSFRGFCDVFVSGTGRLDLLRRNLPPEVPALEKLRREKFSTIKALKPPIGPNYFHPSVAFLKKSGTFSICFPGWLLLFWVSLFYKILCSLPVVGNHNRPQKAPTSRRMQSRSVAVRSKNPRSVGSFGGKNDCEIPGSTFWSVQGWVKHKKAKCIRKMKEIVVYRSYL